MRPVATARHGSRPVRRAGRDVGGDGGVDALLPRSPDACELDALVTLSIPYDRGDIAAAAHRAGQVVDEVATDGALRVQVRLADTEIGRFEPWVVDGGGL
jgi:hypothetical protein